MANSGKEINCGDKILIVGTVSTPLGVARMEKVAVVTKKLMGKLIEDGKVNVVEEKTTNKIWNNAIESLAKKTNWKKEKLSNILTTLHIANPWAAS